MNAGGFLIIFILLVFFSSGYCQNSDSITVFKDVNLIPMTSNIVIPHQTVIIEGKRIREIGNMGSVRIPTHAQIINGEGKYLMPGLADMHAHYLADYERDSFFNLFLKNGVTTVRLFQSFPNDSVLVWKDKITRHELLGPTLFTCGMMFNGPELPASSILTSKRNYDFIKIYGDLSSEEFKDVMKIARQEKIYTIGHIPFLVGLDSFIREGMNEIAHAGELDYELVDFPKRTSLRPMFGYVIDRWVKQFYQTNLTPGQYLQLKDLEMNAIVAKVKASGMFVNTTSVVPKIIVEQLYEKDKFMQRPELKYMIRSFMTDYRAGQNTYTLQMAQIHKKHKKIMKGDDGRKFIEVFYKMNLLFVKKLHEADVPLLLATDTPAEVVAVVPGYSVHEEMQIYVGNGFAPYEAIKTGTFNAGRAVEAMTGTNSIGTIEIDKQADLILTNSNPLDDIANIRDIQGIMVQGRWLSKISLDSLEVIMKTSITDALMDVARKKPGVENLINKYQEIKADSLKYYAVLESPLNELGYKLCNLKRFEEGIEVFRINTIEFSNSWNAFDSLGEAYMRAGNKTLAIENYEKSIILNPNNEYGKAVLKKIKRK